LALPNENFCCWKMPRARAFRKPPIGTAGALRAECEVLSFDRRSA
jgi:hypothetical protein